MTLASTLARSVDAGVRKRGQQYFRDGKVSIVSSGREVVEATVSGSDQYSVLLTRESKRLYASCTCVYFLDREEPCKHIWATVLAACGARDAACPARTSSRRASAISPTPSSRSIRA